MSLLFAPPRARRLPLTALLTILALLANNAWAAEANSDDLATEAVPLSQTVSADAVATSATDTAAPKPSLPCASPLLDAVLAAHERLCHAGTCVPEDLAVLDAAVDFLKTCAARQSAAPAVDTADPTPSLQPSQSTRPMTRAPLPRWIFPVSRMRPVDSMGGPDGKGYLKNRRVKCYATARAGHPAHDLFVRDRRQSGRDRQGRAFEALAVEAGYVMSVKRGWTEDGGAGGNYLLLYLPARNWVAYYAHMASISVEVGQRVEAGESLGVIGRSGRNAKQSRSPTHLHFAIWNPENNWMPLDPYSLLRNAKTIGD